jgi:hypothetical protein
MKRIRLLVLLGVVVVALPLGAVFAGNAGAAGSTTTNSVSIRQYADFNLKGVQLDVGLNVRCTGGTGTATVHVTQTPPESTRPVSGFGIQDVVCDGQTHSVGVTVVGTMYDAGKAYATAEVETLNGGTASAARWITIQVV